LKTLSQPDLESSNIFGLLRSVRYTAQLGPKEVRFQPAWGVWPERNS